MNDSKKFKTIDFSSFSNPITKTDLEHFKLSTKQTLIVLLVAFALFTIVVMWAAISQGSLTLETYFSISIPTIMLFVLIWLFTRRQMIQEARLRRFAERNGFTFTADADVNAEVGTLFHTGHSRAMSQIIAGKVDDLQFQFGDFRYEVGSGRSARTYKYHFMSTTLPRPVPQVILDSRFSSAAFSFTAFSNSEKLSLEGDFDAYFKVHIPQGYGADVLYFLTPELMEALKQAASRFDIEFIDNKLYFYSSNSKNVREEDLRIFFAIIEKVSLEAWDNTRRYVDARMQGAEKLPNNGARIAKKIPINVVVTGAVILAVYIFWIVSSLTS